MDKESIKVISDTVFIEFAKILMKTEMLSPNQIARLSPDMDLVHDLDFDSSRILQLKLILESQYKVPVRCLQIDSKSIMVHDVVRHLIVYSSDDSLFRWLNIGTAGAA